ncbi:MAG: phage tail tape measure protein, partial [Desulfobacterales bacterium]
FNGDDRVSSTITNISGRMGQLNQVADTIATPFAAVADGVLAADAALTALATGSLVYSFQKAKEFESGLVELEKVLGDQPEMLRRMGDEALRLSNQYGEASSDILQSMADWKQAGFSAEESMALTKDAMDLVIAGSMEAGSATEILVAALKGFRAPATDARQILDVLNITSNEYATNTEELGKGLAELSPILKMLGYSYEESVGLLTPVIEVFRSGEEAARGLRTGLLRLADPTPEVEAALAAMGVASRDANGEFRSGREVLLDVQKAWGGLTSAQQTNLASVLAGKDQAAKMAVVFGSLSYQLEVTANAHKGAGSAIAEVESRLQSAEVIVRRFKEGIANLGTVVGLQFQEAAKSSIDGGTEIMNTLQGLVESGAFEPLFEALRNYFDQLGEYLKDVAEVLPEAVEGIDWSGLLDAFGKLGDTIRSFFGGIDLTTAQGLNKAMQEVMDTVEALVRISDGMLQAFRPIFDTIARFIDEINNSDEATQKHIGSLLTLAKVVKDLGLAFGLLNGGMAESGAGINALFNFAAGGLKVLKNAFESLLDVLMLGMVSLLEMPLNLMESIANVPVPGMEKVREVVQGLSGDLDNVKKKFQENFVENTRDAADGFSLMFGRIGEDAEITHGKVTGLLSDITDSLEKLPDEKRVSVEIDSAGVALSDAEEISRRLDEASETRTVEILPFSPPSSIDDLLRKYDDKLSKNPPKVKPVLETLNAEDALKRLEIQANLLDSAMKYQAEVDIAQAEAAAKQMEAAFGSVNTGIESTGETLQSLFGLLTDPKTSAWDKLDLRSTIAEETKLRQKEIELQQRLVASTVAYNEARTERLTSGEALISIQCDGLRPELEAIMWKILEFTQMRMTEEAAEALLAIGGAGL